MIFTGFPGRVGTLLLQKYAILTKFKTKVKNVGKQKRYGTDVTEVLTLPAYFLKNTYLGKLFIP